MKLLRKQVIDRIDNLIWKFKNGLTYPEDNAPLKPEIEAYLRLPMEEKGPFFTLDEIKRELDCS